jgi:hypothetical protein
MSYRLAPRGVVRLADTYLVTRDMPEWQVYRAWLHAGNVPQPMPQPPSPTVAGVLAKVKEHITARREFKQRAGATVAGTAFDTDERAFAHLAQMLQFSALRPLRVFKVRTANNQHVTLTAAQLGNLFEALSERAALCADNEAVHYAAVAAIASNGATAAARIAALRAYDFSTGWPD